MPDINVWTDDLLDISLNVRKQTLEEFRREIENGDIDMAEPNIAFEYKDGWNDSLNVVLDRLDDRIKECD